MAIQNSAAQARRWLAILVAPVVIAAGIILYGFPTRTAELFAWPIAPTMTPIVMGAGYLAATWFFYRLGTSKQWAAVASVLGGVLVFTLVMLASTLLHWERFSHGKFTFWLWLVVYLLSPLAVAGVILMHRRTGDANNSGPTLSAGLRALFAVVFTLLFVIAMVMVFAPAVAMAWWPWKLSPLTSRVIGGWVAVLGVGGLLMCRSAYWPQWKVGIETGLLWFVLVALATPGALADFASPAKRLGYLLALAFLVLLFGLTWWKMERARRPTLIKGH